MFQKGNNANPTGRPKKTEQQINFEYKCRNWADLFAYDKLKKIADGDDLKGVQWATKEMLDRGFGTPVATVYQETNATVEIGSSVADLAAELAALIGKSATESGASDLPDKVDGGK